jgi:hypothetical protein
MLQIDAVADMSRLSRDPGRLGTPRGDALHLLAEQIRRGRRLLRRVEAGDGVEAERAYRRWLRYTERLLRFVAAPEHEPVPPPRALPSHRRMREVLRSALLNDLRARLLELECVAGEIAGSGGRADRPRPPGAAGSRVLVVHGRNEAAREHVARFLLTLGLEPVVVAEAPGRGRTLIEKLEAEATVAFAVVLLTGDDVGGLGGQPRRLNPRARQNVIFELGFAIGRLGRDRVHALYEPGVELPSDYRGVQYTPLDPAGAWRTMLARELRSAGLAFDPIRLL